MLAVAQQKAKCHAELAMHFWCAFPQKFSANRGLLTDVMRGPKDTLALYVNARQQYFIISKNFDFTPD